MPHVRRILRDWISLPRITAIAARTSVTTDVNKASRKIKSKMVTVPSYLSRIVMNRSPGHLLEMSASTGYAGGGGAIVASAIILVLFDGCMG